MKTILALLAAALVPCGTFAASTNLLYAAKEFNIGAGVGARTPDFKHYTETYDLNLSYFVSQKVGFRGRVEHVGFDVDNQLVSDTSVAVIFRIPIHESSFAPYMLAGGGYSFFDHWWHADLGAGLEYRFTSLIGAYVEAAAQPVFESGANTWRFGGGVRFAF